MARFARRGMTLVELLVVIAIIAVLTGLLLPAILQARGAGRIIQCESNLKQLAQAVQTFHHRNNSLPVYWGPMKGGGGEKFGGWLLHLLPDMEQQVLYDKVPASTTSTSGSMQVVVSSTTRSLNPREFYDPIPASPDYQEGEWQQVAIGTGFVNGMETTIKEWQLVGRVGTPAQAGGEYTRTEETLGWVPNTTTIARVAAEYLPLARQATIPCLTDTEDPGLMRSRPVPVTTSTTSLDNMQLTNYMANAHVFTKFGGGRITAGAQAGLFPSPMYWSTGVNPIITGTWRHSLSGTTGPIGRTFAHVGDGLTNTILFAEGMRQSDNLAQYRAAFFPSGNPMNEHGFGIECQWRGANGLLLPAFADVPSYGNTLMFQTMPKLHEANPLRAQALHGNYLMVAMCDGSTRAISSLVSRREPIAANASGRENFGTKFYNATSRGASEPDDGIWDMLMVPNDPPGNVLSNDGTIGRER